MMDYQQQLDLQAYLDGELSEAKARRVAAWLAQDAEAAALAIELRQTRSAVTGYEKEIRLPESREFYWSKIQREIQRQERAEPNAERLPEWLKVIRRLLMPATAMAMVAFIAVMVGRQPTGIPSETALTDTGAMTYRDFEKGATLVWLSYPADNEFADYEAAMFE
ncbi:MAG TPA: hypothetical protein VJA21_30990 [Verrucomicrobiae bacterium]